MTLLRSGALVKHPMGFRPARANSLGWHTSMWKSPSRVHLGACVSPNFYSADASALAGDVPMRDGFPFILGDTSTPSGTTIGSTGIRRLRWNLFGQDR